MIQQKRYRRELTKIRSGTHELGLETERWLGALVEDRTCWVCGKEALDDERHLLVDCWPFEGLRVRLFRSVRNMTFGEYRLAMLRDEPEVLVDALIGKGPPDKRFRRPVLLAVSRFLRKAMQLRKKWAK